MQSKLKTGVCILLMVLIQALPRSNAATGDLSFPDPNLPISMDFQDANLKDLLKIFSIQSGLNFIASEAVQDRRITLFLDKVPIKEAMDKLFIANNLYYDLDKGSNIFIVKDYGKVSVNTITKVFKLQYLSVPSSAIERDKSTMLTEGGSSGGAAGGTGDIISLIRQILTENGKIAEHARTNSLIITDTPNNFPVIEQVIASLDVPQPMIMLEVEMLDVSKNEVDKLGVNWPDTLASLTVSGFGLPALGRACLLILFPALAVRAGAVFLLAASDLMSVLRHLALLSGAAALFLGAAFLAPAWSPILQLVQPDGPAPLPTLYASLFHLVLVLCFLGASFLAMALRRKRAAA